MRRTIATLLLAFAPVPVALAADDAEPKKDLEQLQGKWVVVGKEFMGKKATKEELEDLAGETVIKGRVMTVWAEECGKKTRTSEAKFEIDPKAKPKGLDLEYTFGPVEGKAAAIYEVKGDTLKICFPLLDGDRPKELATKADGKTVLVTYERVKK